MEGGGGCKSRHTEGWCKKEEVILQNRDRKGREKEQSGRHMDRQETEEAFLQSRDGKEDGDRVGVGGGERLEKRPV